MVYFVHFHIIDFLRRWFICKWTFVHLCTVNFVAELLSLIIQWLDNLSTLTISTFLSTVSLAYNFFPKPSMLHRDYLNNKNMKNIARRNWYPLLEQGFIILFEYLICKCARYGKSWYQKYCSQERNKNRKKISSLHFSRISSVTSLFLA